MPLSEPGLSYWLEKHIPGELRLDSAVETEA